MNEEMNIGCHDAGHMTKMAAMPLYGKTPSNIFFSGTSGPETLSKASETPAHHSLFKLWP